MTMTLTLSTPEKPKRAARPKPEADADTLRRLAARIEELKDIRIDQLIEELFEAEKLRMKTVGEVMTVTLAGISAESTAGRHAAIANWAMAARRKIAELEG